MDRNNEDEVEHCNHAVQVYSCGALFYKNDRPTLDEAFKCGQHHAYTNPENPINTLFNALPGVRSKGIF